MSLQSQRGQFQRRKHLSFPFLLLLFLVVLDYIPFHTRSISAWSSSSSSRTTRLSLGVGVLGDLVVVSTVVAVTETVLPVTTGDTGLAVSTAGTSTGTGAGTPEASTGQVQGSVQQTTSSIENVPNVSTAVSNPSTLISSTTTSPTSFATSSSESSSSTTPEPSPTNADSPSKKLPTYAIVLVSCGAVVGFAALSTVVFFLWSRQLAKRFEASPHQKKSITTDAFLNRTMPKKQWDEVPLKTTRTERFFDAIHGEYADKDQLTALNLPDNIEEIDMSPKQPQKVNYVNDIETYSSRALRAARPEESEQRTQGQFTEHLGGSRSTSSLGVSGSSGQISHGQSGKATASSSRIVGKNQNFPLPQYPAPTRPLPPTPDQGNRSSAAPPSRRPEHLLPPLDTQPGSSYPAYNAFAPQTVPSARLSGNRPPRGQGIHNLSPIPDDNESTEYSSSVYSRGTNESPRISTDVMPTGEDRLFVPPPLNTRSGSGSGHHHRRIDSATYEILRDYLPASQTRSGTNESPSGKGEAKTKNRTKR